MISLLAWGAMGLSIGHLLVETFTKPSTYFVVGIFTGGGGTFSEKYLKRWPFSWNLKQ
jgi:hypothetical protein